MNELRLCSRINDRRQNKNKDTELDMHGTLVVRDRRGFDIRNLTGRVWLYAAASFPRI